MNENKRIYYWDNVKSCLIFLVVLGHFLIPILHRGTSIACCFYFIYFFHMPAFVFVSGFFSKRYIEKGKGSPDISKILGFLILYVVFKGIQWGISCIFQRQIVAFDFLDESGAPWYMFAMAVWYLILPMFTKFKWYISIGVAVLAALYVGRVESINSFLCLSRIIVYYPFFLMGHYFKGENIKFVTNRKGKICGMMIFLLIGCLIIFNLNNIKLFDALFYGNRPYSILPDDISLMTAGFARFLFLVIGLLMTFALMAWIPRRKLKISYIGGRTLSIYILHIIVRDVFEQIHIFDRVQWQGEILLLGCVIFCLILTIVLSGKLFNKLFSSVFKINYSIFMR